MRIVVAGGTGRIGARVVARLRAEGHDAVAVSRSDGVDVVTGAGLAAALAGADVVVDTTRPHTYDPDGVREFFTGATANLLAAGRVAGVGRHVTLTIVGTDDLPPVAYYRAKAAQEQLVREAGTPYTLVHATQFFEFAAGIADSATADGTVRLPGILVQPVAADDVARAVADAATSAAAVTDVEVAGPDVLHLDDFVRRALAATGDAREVRRDPDATYFGGHLGERALLPSSGARIGDIAFGAWLAASA